MPVCLSHTSAFELYRECVRRGIRVGRLPRCDLSKAHSAMRVMETLDECGFGDCLTLPVHVLVKERTHPRRQEGVARHGVSASLPKKSVVRIAGDLYAVSPELCIAQSGTVVSEADLALMAFEMCGTYSLVRGDIGGSEIDKEAGGGSDVHDESAHVGLNVGAKREVPTDALDASACGGPNGMSLVAQELAIPLTTCRRINRAIAHAPWLHGVKSARAVMQYVRDGSASPMETAMAMLLTAPSRIGGMGFEPGILNGEIHADEGLRRIDLLWPRYRLGLEYQGKEPHEGWRKRIEDDERRNVIVSTGINVMAVYFQDLVRSDRLDCLVRNIARAMGRRIRVRVRDHRHRQMVLQSKVLPPIERR